MTLHPRNRLPLALAIASLLSLLWLWQMTLPLLDAQTDALEQRRAELRQRQQAATAEIYQPLIGRLQTQLPAPAIIITALKKISASLGLANVTYSLAQPQPAEHNALMLRRLSIGLPSARPAAALALWQDLRQALPCELRLVDFTGDDASARLELELMGGS